jgi:spermidine synthase
MKRTVLLEKVTTPDGSLMSLHEHDGTYSIRVDGRELMSTRHYHSEEKLAEVACAHLRKAADARVLIGGLGLGFTLRAALRLLPAGGEAVVAELMPAVIEWNRNPAYGLGHDALSDPRTRLEQGDVFGIIAKAQARGRFDAIMLDADNGTTAMSTEGNERLYDDTGLALVRAALRRGGTAVYWSAQQEPLFAKKMGRAGFDVETLRVRAHASSGGMHTLLVGRTR